eukprot:723746-Rhodomonas_salina.2
MDSGSFKAIVFQLVVGLDQRHAEGTDHRAQIDGRRGTLPLLAERIVVARALRLLRVIQKIASWGLVLDDRPEVSEGVLEAWRGGGLPVGLGVGWSRAGGVFGVVANGRGDVEPALAIPDVSDGLAGDAVLVCECKAHTAGGSAGSGTLGEDGEDGVLVEVSSDWHDGRMCAEGKVWRTGP